METVTVKADNLVFFLEDFKGRVFFGKGKTPKGKLVDARLTRRAGGRAAVVEVTFESVKPGPFGPLDSVTFPGDSMVRVSAAEG